MINEEQLRQITEKVCADLQPKIYKDVKINLLKNLIIKIKDLEN